MVELTKCERAPDGKGVYVPYQNVMKDGVKTAGAEFLTYQGGQWRNPRDFNDEKV